jgi:ATP-dependent exoDNAse (exonuclease V) alpha subunit
VVAVDASNGLRVRTDSGQVRQIDPEYASGHLDYAYALTGHRMQGATVEWAGVIGTPADFTRNWSYTALSRAREPVEIFLVDDLSQLQHDRAEIAPGVDRDDRPGPVERMAERMRERDDEDLAVEQLPPTRQARSPSRPSRVSSTRPDA